MPPITLKLDAGCRIHPPAQGKKPQIMQIDADGRPPKAKSPQITQITQITQINTDRY